MRRFCTIQRCIAAINTSTGIYSQATGQKNDMIGECTAGPRRRKSGPIASVATLAIALRRWLSRHLSLKQQPMLITNIQDSIIINSIIVMIIVTKVKHCFGISYIEQFSWPFPVRSNHFIIITVFV